MTTKTQNKMKKPIKNIQDLTADLVSNYEKLSSGQLSESKAKELTSIAGKIISSAKTHLDYNSYMKIKRQIKFLDVK